MSKLPTTSKLVTKVKVIGGLLSLMIIVIIALGIVMSNKSERDSFVINLAGKQRMLSQRIVKDVYFIKAKDSFDFVDLDNSIEEFDFNLKSLIFGDKTLDIEAPQTLDIAKKLEEVSVIWKPFPIIVEALKNNIQEIKKDKDLYMEYLNKLLDFSDDIVAEMVNEGLEGEYINLAGRQRMLSQRMTIYFNRYLKTMNQQDFYHFSNTQKLYDTTLQSFLNDAVIKQKANLYAFITRNDNFWQEYKRFINKMLDKEIEINEYIAYIQNNNINLLETMDEAVWLYTDHSENKIDTLKSFQYTAGALALLIMIYSFMLTRDLEMHLDMFVQKVKDFASGDISSQDDMHIDFACEAELKEASSHLNLFAKKVNDAMQHSEDAVKKAELAIDELQNISLEVENAIKSAHMDESEKKMFNKNLGNTEDIAIESTENLIHVSKLLKKLQANLGNISDTYNKNVEKKES